jgi:hypothetical protein
VIILKGCWYNGYWECAGEGTYLYGGANEACFSYYGMAVYLDDWRGPLLTSIAHISEFCLDTGKYLCLDVTSSKQIDIR